MNAHMRSNLAVWELLVEIRHGVEGLRRGVEGLIDRSMRHEKRLSAIEIVSHRFMLVHQPGQAGYHYGTDVGSVSLAGRARQGRVG